MKKYVLDMDKYAAKAREAAAEGQVLLKNTNAVLPLKAGTEVAVFGRIQNHYYKSGTGSGGMVNVNRVVGIMEALDECDSLKVNGRLREAYAEWEKEHPYDEGKGWGGEPWSQAEMELDPSLVEAVAKETDTALVIIGRTAGEDRDNANAPGAYLLSEAEEAMMKVVRRSFPKMIVVLNVGNIIDMKFVEQYNPDAVLYAWQGGMLGGYGTVDVLAGKVNPSGHLTDTIAYDITDYPSNNDFGDPIRNFYREDIYVGYRYFESIAKEKVQYPFGYGLSYTKFEQALAECTGNGERTDIKVKVKNVGEMAGKQVLQLYVASPSGKLAKPAVTLLDFAKTKNLSPSEEQEISLSASLRDMCSYDETGVTGYPSALVLETGVYTFYVGENVRDIVPVGSMELKETKCVEQLRQAMAPTIPFERIRIVEDEKGTRIVTEDVPLRSAETKERKRTVVKEITFTGDKGYKLSDVKDGKVTIEEFVAQFTDDDLTCIVRGEGMGSPKVTAGTASAFGGVNQHLKEMQIPCACCDDGPSGMRLDSGAKAFSLPNGTLLACTFNTQLVQELYAFTGVEMIKNKVDCLLGPGMNIHRHPLNGRNFEYFSEDPVVTGRIGGAIFRGLQSAGVTGVAKHFCANNQETNRHHMENVVSERALREIYLKGFEIAVKESGADAIMTTYGCVNGLWTAGNYDLNTTILREEWGFDGVVMSDWWAQINEEGAKPSKTNFAAMVRAQNDMYMVCSDSSVNSSGDNTMEALKEGKLSRGELQRCAMNICRFLLHTHAYTRLVEEETVEVTGNTEDGIGEQEDAVYYKIEGELIINLENVATARGKSFSFGLESEVPGEYSVEIIARSKYDNELAQIPIALFNGGLPDATFTYNGGCTEWTAEKRMTLLMAKYTIMRMDFMQTGLELKEVRIKLNRHAKDVPEMAWFFDSEKRV